MKKRLSTIVLACLLVVLLVGIPVLAISSAPITVIESSGNSYDMIGVTASMDNAYLASHGFITSTGLDVDISSLSFMLASDRTIVATPLAAYGTALLPYTTGNTPASAFHILTGYNGYITIPDNDSIELGSNFEIEQKGWIDTSGVGDNLVYKEAAFKTYISADEEITSKIYGEPVDLAVTANDVAGSLYAGATIREGQRYEDFPAVEITSISFYLMKTGLPTGTLYVRVRRVSDDVVIGTIGSMDVESLTGALAWYDFTTDPIDNPAVQNVRVLAEYEGGNDANYVVVRHRNADVGAGALCRFVAGWQELATRDSTHKVSYVPFVAVTAAEVSSGVHTVKTRANATFLELLVDTDNILWNSDFEVGDPPTGWTKAANATTLSRSNTQAKIGTYSALLTRVAGAACYFYQVPPNWAYYKGRTVTIGGWVYATAADRARLHIYDGGNAYSAFHSGVAGWEWLTATKTIDVAAAFLWPMGRIDGEDVSAHFDGIILVEGDSIPAGYIPNPPVTVALGAATVPPNAYDYTIMQNNVMPYMEYMTIDVATVEKLKYLPVSIISGTTLIDETGSNDGTITWGSNPAGVAASIGALLPEIVITPATTAANVPDLTPEFNPSVSSGVEGENFPFYGLFKSLTEEYHALGGPEIAMPFFWKVVAMIIALVLGTVTLVATRNVLIGLGAYALFIAVPTAMGILDWYYIVWYIVGATAVALLVTKWTSSSI